jgi:signal transduction histidine kinase/ligand-binding sensor domain-containing protein/DNA-binding response OmpR family regulator
MKFRFELYILLSLLWVLLTSERTKFSHLTIQDGLSQSSVKSIFQDSKGFLWFGTADGLNKYDGYGFEIISSNPTDPLSISGNDISCIYENPYDSTLWIGTQNAGLNIYNREQNNFYSFSLNSKLKHKITSNFIKDIIVTNDSILWIATSNGGLCYFNEQDSSFIKPMFTKQCNLRTINCLEKDESGNLWLGTSLGLYKWKYKNRDGNEIPTKVNFDKNAKNKNITSLKFDLKGNLWIGTPASGLFQYHPILKTTSHFYPDNTDNCLAGVRIYDILLQKNGDILIGTNNGLCKYLPITKDFEVCRNNPNNSESLNNNIVYSLFEDRAGIVWVGVYLGGINKIDPIQSRFEKYNNFTNLKNEDKYLNNILSINVDHLNTIWLGTSNGLVEINNKKTLSGSNVKIHFKGKEMGAIIAFSEELYISMNGRIFVLDSRNKLISISEKIKSQTKYTINGFSSAISDELNQIWFTTARGLLRYSSDENKFALFNPEGPDGEPISFIPISIDEDQTGKIWLGTFDGNLYSFDKFTNKFELVISTIFNNERIGFTRIFSVCTSVFGEVWIGTDLGLYKVDIKSGDVVRYLKSDGLPNNVIYATIADKNGNIWCSTNVGVSRLNPKTGEFQNYTYQDGLQSNEFNQGAYFKDYSGKIYFGGIDGLNVFDPEKVIKNSYIPQVVISGMEIQYEKVSPFSHPQITDKQISEIKELTLNNKQNTFSFEFAALSFSLSKRNQYQYSLTKVGENDRWIKSGNRRIATFTNVPPGNYIFKVLGSNSDGIFNEVATEIKIFITPPFWQTWWFKLLFILFVLGLVYLVIYIRIRSIHKQKNVLKKLVIEKTKTLSRQKEQIEKQNKELKIINEKIVSKNDKITHKNKQLSNQHLQISKQRDSLLQLADHVKEVNQTKFRFFTSVSHELRTPLTLVISPLKELIENVGENSKNETLRKLNNIYNNASKLLLIVNQLLDFRKAETDNLRLQISKFELTPFIQKVAFLFNDLATRKEIDFTFSSEAINLKIWADKDKLEKTMYNLLSNAFKATKDDGIIKIHIAEGVEQKKKIVLISIKDNGVGIDADKIPLIFERFFQLDDTSNLPNSGSGLGLALVKKYIDLHNGSITVKSSVGQGSEFIIKLPVGRNHFGEKVKFDERKTENKELLIASIGEYISTSTENKKRLNDNEKSTLLLIDDDDNLRSYMKEVLSIQYNMELAGSAITGVKLAKTKMPDLIICDIMLPDYDGFAVCEKLKSEFKTSHIPVILLTSLADNENKMNSIKAGADAYITKPFDLQHLILVIENLIDGRSKLHKKFSLSNSGNIEDVITDSTDQVFIKNTIKYIEQNMSNSDFNVEKLCSLLKISQPQCYRKIKAITGCSISEFIRNARLKRAAKLLRTGDCKINEAAYNAGFNDPNYFTKSFIKLFGMTPRDYTKL